MNGTGVAYSISHNGRRADNPGKNIARTNATGTTMADTIKGKLKEAGDAISETASKVGHKVSENAEAAKDWVKEKLHKADNRAEEAADKVENKVDQAKVDADAKAKSGDCCGG